MNTSVLWVKGKQSKSKKRRHLLGGKYWKSRDTPVFLEKTTKTRIDQEAQRARARRLEVMEGSLFSPLPAQRAEWEEREEHKAGVEHKEESRRVVWAERSASEFLKGGSLRQTVIPSLLMHLNSMIVCPR